MYRQCHNGYLSSFLPPRSRSLWRFAHGCTTQSLKLIEQRLAYTFVSHKHLHSLLSYEMLYQRQLSALLLPLMMSLSACIDSHGLAKNRPAHHTGDGFQNNYLPPERMTKSFSNLWRWRQNRIAQEPVQFELIKPDVDFLRENRTVPTLTWIGHSTFLWQYQGSIWLPTPIWLNEHRQ